MEKISNNQCPSPLILGGAKEQEEQKEVTVEQSQENEGDSFGKFKSAKALLDAYTNLEIEFTKRSQELKRLEKENEGLKAEQARSKDNTENKEEISVIASEPVEYETGTAVVEQPDGQASAKSEEGDEDIAQAVTAFLSKNPEAGQYAEEIALKTSERGEISEGFLERAYIGVLQDQVRKEQSKINDEFVYTYASETPAVREKIIRDYLNGILASKSVSLLSSGGQSVIMPPKKPLTISQAGEMASEILRKK